LGVFRIQIPEASGSGQPYGSPLLIPLIGGSGGGGAGAPGTSTGRGGGGGGGAILIASNSRIIINGAIVSNGGIGGTQGNVATNGGSGGAIRLVAPRISGNPNLNVNSQSLGFNSHGRIRIDTYDRTGISSSLSTTSFGSVMVVFPATLPKLSIAIAAGTDVSEDQVNPVSVILPAGSSPNQIIRVRARDFGGLVPIRVRLVPESAAAVTYDAEIDNTVTNPATVDVPVTFPVNTGVRVEVFTR
jgi:hypothetical protein